MASFSKMFSVEKDLASVWTHFRYDEKQKRSKCLVSECRVCLLQRRILVIWRIIWCSWW